MDRCLGLWLVCVVSLALVCPASCGKKAAPFLPEAVFHLTVDPLNAKVVDGKVRLTGPLAGEGDESIPAQPGIRGCRVFHAWFPLDAAPCETCPIRFGPPQIVASCPVVEGNFACRIPFEGRKGVHLFEVRLIGPRDTPGPVSSRAKVVLK